MTNALPRLRRMLLIIALMITFLPNPTAFVTAQSPLDDADSMLLRGEYDAAVALYSAALADPAVRCDALFSLGTTYLRAGRYEAADAEFTRFLGECDVQFRVLVMRGQARQQLGLSAQAIEDYQQAITLSPGVLDSYLYEQMATLNPDQGIYYLRLASESPRALESKVALREKLAKVYLLIGSSEEALTQYDLLLGDVGVYIDTLNGIEGAEFDKTGALRARIEYAAAQIEVDNGQFEAGYNRLQHVIAAYPETDSALPALIDLIVAGQPVDLLQRMRINVFNENYFPVVDVLVDYLNDPATRATAPGELFLLLGRAQRGMDDPEAAIETFSALSDEFPADPAASAALLELGQTYEQVGDNQQALQTYTRLVDTYPQSPDIPQALLNRANLSRIIGDLAGALSDYQALAQAYPEADQTTQSIFEAAKVVANSDLVLAAELFGLSGTSKGFLWQGNALARSGNVQAAQMAWRQATAAEPGTFFAMRACALLTDTDLFAPADVVTISPLTADDRAASEQWVAETFGIEGVSASLAPDLANDPILRRGTALWAVGMWADVRAEFDMLHTLKREDPAALLQLAFHYQSIGVYRSSLFAATRLVFASEQPFSQIPVGVLRLAYPLQFTDVILPLAEEYGIDPLLIGAVVRQESGYDPTVQSGVGARGLMQLMPATANDIVSRLALAGFSLSDLTRPVVNIRLGAFYLASMLSYQDGSIPGALLSYNAGPGYAASWLLSAGGDLEQLYEAITFDETRLYLELITEHYIVYRYLYGGVLPACMVEPAQAGVE